MVNNKEHMKHLNGWLRGADIIFFYPIYPRAGATTDDERFPSLSVLLQNLQPNMCVSMNPYEWPMHSQPDYFDGLPAGVFGAVTEIEARWMKGLRVTDRWLFRQNLRDMLQLMPSLRYLAFMSFNNGKIHLNNLISTTQ